MARELRRPRRSTDGRVPGLRYRTRRRTAAKDAAAGRSHWMGDRSLSGRRRAGINFFNRFRRALKTDLRMGSVAERLHRGAAAAAKRLLRDRNLVAVGVDELEIAFDEQRTVL